MAKIIDVPTSGKIGLTVTYPGRNGLIRRAWVSPANPKTGAQLLVRSTLTTVARAWRGLTELQRQAWIALAGTLQTQPVLGQSGPLTGSQLFTKINAANLAIGGELVNTPPAIPPDFDTKITGVEITNTGGNVVINLVAPDSPPEGTTLRGAAPQSAGSYRPVSFRQLGTLDSPVGGKINVTAAYTARFGVPPVGTRVFVQVNANLSGWEGPRITYAALVPQSS